MVAIGQKAPSIILFSSDKKLINLKDYKGKNVLLLFFPQAFTSVCTAELCSVRDNISQYSNVDAEVFGISVDSVFTLRKFKEEQQFNYTLLSDFNKEVSKSYGCYYENWILDMKGVSKRAAFIIDKNGNIQYTEVLEDAGNTPNFNAIIKKLASLV